MKNTKLLNRDTFVIGYTLLLTLIKFKTLVMRGNLERASAILPSIPKDRHNSVALFLESRGMIEEALEVATDPDYRFDLAIQLGKLEIAKDIALVAQSESKWKQLGELAMSNGLLDMAEDCLKHANDLTGLLLLYSSLGDAEGIIKLASLAKENGKNNVAFACLFMLGKLEDCLQLLVDSNRIPVAALMARSYLPNKVSEIVALWRKDLNKVNQKAAESLVDTEEYSNMFEDWQIALEVEARTAETRVNYPPATEYVNYVDRSHVNLVEVFKNMQLDDEEPYENGELDHDKLIIFGGVGIACLPPSLIFAFIRRPKAVITRSQYIKEATELGKKARELKKAADALHQEEISGSKGRKWRKNMKAVEKVHHNMDAPLSHYFIFTGHNSYLTGNQLSSDCSDVPIVQALERGVRVIELDIWPNSNKDDVIVLHGRTLTTPVELIKCFRSIKAHAFNASEYPVVITLEDHLTTDLQAKVAKMVTETFGDMLFTPDAESLAEFPSPESLKRRVIISTKPPKEYLKSQESKAGGMGSQREKDSAAEAWGGEIPRFNSRNTDDSKQEDLEEEHDEEDFQDDHCAPEYRNLIAIHAGKGKGGLDDWLKVDPDKVRRLSLSEQELENAAKTHGPQIVRFTQRNILRVYPKGIRFDSSNYNPLIGWMHGAQMVAFNMQGYGRSLWVMQGMFKANGGCGYVKKPEILMNNEAIFDPRVSLPVKITLKVTVYMGEGWYYDFKHTHFDAYSPPDFYTRVGIAGVPADTIMKRTKAIEDNWIPAWNEQFEFQLTVPELAILRIEVHEYDMSEKDDFGGQTCLPISELRKGIRAVPLYSQKGEKYKSVKLLMHFDF